VLVDIGVNRVGVVGEAVWGNDRIG